LYQRLLIVFFVLFCAGNAAANQRVLPANSQSTVKYVHHRKGISAKNAAKIREVERVSKKVAIAEAKIKKVEAQIAAVEARERE